MAAAPARCLRPSAAALCTIALLLSLHLTAVAAAHDCSAHPWIDKALEKWFAPSYEVARSSTKTVEESLKEIADIQWYAHAMVLITDPV
jgi:hypothetical protein